MRKTEAKIRRAAAAAAAGEAAAGEAGGGLCLAVDAFATTASARCRSFSRAPFLPGPLSTVVKRLIWDFAGVRSGLGANGPRWLQLKAAAENLGLGLSDALVLSEQA